MVLYSNPGPERSAVGKLSITNAGLAVVAGLAVAVSLVGALTVAPALVCAAALAALSGLVALAEAGVLAFGDTGIAVFVVCAQLVLPQMLAKNNPASRFTRNFVAVAAGLGRMTG